MSGSQEQQGGGGAEGATGAAGAAGATGGVGSPGATGGTGATGGQRSPDDVDIFDAAVAGEIKKDEAGKAIRPEHVPEQFWNAEKGEVNVEALLKSQRDLRGQLSQKGGKGTEAPPEKPDGYVLPKVEGLPEGAIGGPQDTLLPAIRDAAHKAGVTQAQFDAMAKPYLTQVAKQLADQAAAADPEKTRDVKIQEMRAELAKLGPDGAAMAKATLGWITGMETAGVLTANEALQLRAIGNADGIRALMKLQERITGEPIPTEALDAAGGSQNDGHRLMTEGYAKNDMAMVEKGRTMLARLDKAGSLRELR